MSNSRKRKQNIPEKDKPNKKSCDLSKIFDSDDDNLILSAMSSAEPMRTVDQSQIQPSNVDQAVRPPLTRSVAVAPAGAMSARPPPPPAARPATSAATSADIDRIMASIGALTGSIDTIKTDIGTRLDDHTRRLASLAREATSDRADIVDLARVIDERTDELSQNLSDTRRELPELVQRAVDARFAETDGGRQIGPQHQHQQAQVAYHPLSDVKEERYLLARKSLHVWPLERASPDALRQFAKNYLDMTDEEFASYEIISITKCRHLPQARIQSEYSVQFASINERDLFRSYAPRLQRHQRSAGMRLALPDFLVSPFKTLEHEAFRIVQRRPGTKRNLRFDDANRAIVLDVKLPGASWVRITYEDVAQAKGARRRERVPAVAEILAIAGEELPENGAEQNLGDRVDSNADMMGDDIAGEQA